MHFLDAPVHMNRLSRRTLDALLEVTLEARPLARRRAKAMARATGREQIGPWDMRAPAPPLGVDEQPMAFDDAIALIADAYGSVDPAMDDFVRMMRASRWIEGTVSSRKRPGAYCTGFEKSRTPRVYMTYHGTTSDVITLAHELGHAFHSWVMRDLPDSQRSYGMSLAETASTFGETAVRDALLARAKTPRERFQIMWEEIAAISAFMLNIPARFSFEKIVLRTARRAAAARGGTGSADEPGVAGLVWRCVLGTRSDVLGVEAALLHFGLVVLQLPVPVRLSVQHGRVSAAYRRRAADFYERYVALLRDTGRMTAEQLARQHLDAALDARRSGAARSTGWSRALRRSKKSLPRSPDGF